LKTSQKKDITSDDQIPEQENEESDSESEKENNLSMHVTNNVQRLSFPAPALRMISDKQVKFSEESKETR
jgi:hypothetical protein